MFTATSRTPRCSTSELESGSVSYLSVHLRPQQRPGPVNTAFQSAYRTAGRLSGFFITLLLEPDQMKGFFLFLRQALIARCGQQDGRPRVSELMQTIQLADTA
jgi:hypothetical protein